MRHTQIVSSAVLLALALAPAAHGHGFMFEPAARNVLTDYEYCPQCLNAGGPWEVSAQGTLVWPAGVHGTCGDPGTGGPNDTPGAVAATYAAGSVITLSLLITARHGGRHEFRVCDRANADEACLSVHTLQRADGGGPYVWMRREGGPADAGAYSSGSVDTYSGETYSIQYQLPAELTCSRCVLQWWWTTGNSCDVPGTPFPTDMLPCTSQGPFPEEFWNCADIAITAAGGGDGAASGGDGSGTKRTASPTPKRQKQSPAPTAVGGRKGSAGGKPAVRSTPAAICAAHGGQGYYAFPSSCAKFVQCGDGGQGFLQSCTSGLVWNDNTKACDYPAATNCGSRPL